MGRLTGPNKARFEEIFTQGLRANGRLCRMFSLPGTGLVGVTTSKAIGCRASRNRQVRRARAALNAQGGADVNLDIAVLVREGAVGAGWNELKEEIGRLLEETRQRWAEGSVSP